MKLSLGFTQKVLPESIFLEISDGAEVEFCRAENVSLVIVGPEAPLEQGLQDRLAEAGIKCFGPSKLAAEIEVKGFMLFSFVNFDLFKRVLISD